MIVASPRFVIVEIAFREIAKFNIYCNHIFLKNFTTLSRIRGIFRFYGAINFRLKWKITIRSTACKELLALCALSARLQIGPRPRENRRRSEGEKRKRRIKAHKARVPPAASAYANERAYVCGTSGHVWLTLNRHDAATQRVLPWGPADRTSGTLKLRLCTDRGNGGTRTPGWRVLLSLRIPHDPARMRDPFLRVERFPLSFRWIRENQFYPPTFQKRDSPDGTPLIPKSCEIIRTATRILCPPFDSASFCH